MITINYTKKLSFMCFKKQILKIKIFMTGKNQTNQNSKLKNNNNNDE
jgi:hypothetical protein